MPCVGLADSYAVLCPSHEPWAPSRHAGCPQPTTVLLYCCAVLCCVVLQACHSALAKAKTLAKAQKLQGFEPPPVTVASKRCPGCKEIKTAECFGR